MKYLHFENLKIIAFNKVGWQNLTVANFQTWKAMQVSVTNSFPFLDPIMVQTDIVTCIQSCREGGSVRSVGSRHEIVMSYKWSRSYISVLICLLSSSPQNAYFVPADSEGGGRGFTWFCFMKCITSYRVGMSGIIEAVFPPDPMWELSSCFVFSLLWVCLQFLPSRLCGAHRSLLISSSTFMIVPVFLLFTQLCLILLFILWFHL